jgi:hypothetical protein
MEIRVIILFFSAALAHLEMRVAETHTYTHTHTHMHRHIHILTHIFTYTNYSVFQCCAPLPRDARHRNTHIHTYTHACIDTYIF